MTITCVKKFGVTSIAVELLTTPYLHCTHTSGLGAWFSRKVKKIQKTVKKISKFTIPRAIILWVKKFTHNPLFEGSFSILCC